MNKRLNFLVLILLLASCKQE